METRRRGRLSPRVVSGCLAVAMLIPLVTVGSCTLLARGLPARGTRKILAESGLTREEIGRFAKAATRIICMPRERASERRRIILGCAGDPAMQAAWIRGAGRLQVAEGPDRAILDEFVGHLEAGRIGAAEIREGTRPAESEWSWDPREWGSILPGYPLSPRTVEETLHAMEAVNTRARGRGPLGPPVTDIPTGLRNLLDRLDAANAP